VVHVAREDVLRELDDFNRSRGVKPRATLIPPELKRLEEEGIFVEESVQAFLPEQPVPGPPFYRGIALSVMSRNEEEDAILFWDMNSFEEFRRVNLRRPGDSPEITRRIEGSLKRRFADLDPDLQERIREDLRIGKDRLAERGFGE
jgi:hypothetical protein